MHKFWIFIGLVSMGTLGACVKLERAAVQPPTTHAATQAGEIRKTLTFSAVRERVVIPDEADEMCMATGNMMALPKDAPNDPREIFKANGIDAFVYTSEPDGRSWHMMATQETEPAGRKVDPGAWDTITAGEVRHLIETARVDGKFADGVSLGSGERGVILFRTARGVMGILRATNEKALPSNVLRLESKLVVEQ